MRRKLQRGGGCSEEELLSAGSVGESKVLHQRSAAPTCLKIISCNDTSTCFLSCLQGATCGGARHHGAIGWAHVQRASHWLAGRPPACLTPFSLLDHP